MHFIEVPINPFAREVLSNVSRGSCAPWDEPFSISNVLLRVVEYSWLLLIRFILSISLIRASLLTHPKD